MSGDTLAPWLRLAANAWLLGAEASVVLPLRLARLARGGPPAQREARLMVAEKIEAHSALLDAWRSGRLGDTAPEIAGGILDHYLVYVRANGRRLSGRAKGARRRGA